MTLADATDAYHQALDRLHQAEQAQTNAHHAHKDQHTERTRAAHYRSCKTVAAAQIAWEKARDQLVAAALEHTP